MSSANAFTYVMRLESIEYCLRSHKGLGLTNVLGSEQKLAIQVGHFNDIEVNDFYVYESAPRAKTTAKARQDEVLQYFAPNPSSSNHKHTGLL